MALVTFAIRYPLFAVAGQFEFPEIVTKALKYVPASVLMAIIAPAILIPDGKTIYFGYGNPALIGGIVAAIISWKSRSLLVTIAGGMLTFFIWRWLIV